MQKQDVVPEIGILMTLWLITVLPVKKAVAVNSQKFIITNEHQEKIQLASTQPNWQTTHPGFDLEELTISSASPDKTLNNTDLKPSQNSSPQFPEYVSGNQSRIFPLAPHDYSNGPVIDVAKPEFIHADAYQFTPAPVIKNQLVIAQENTNSEPLKQPPKPAAEILKIGYLSLDKILISTNADVSGNSDSQFPDYFVNRGVNNTYVIDQVAEPEFIHADAYQFTPQPIIKNQPIAQVIENQQSQPPLEPFNPNLPIPKIPQIPALPDSEEPPQEPPQEPPKKPPSTPTENRTVLTALIRGLLQSSASRYPYVVNTSDQLVINPRNFQPLKSSLYSTFNFDYRTTPLLNNSRRNSLIQSATISLYPQDEQFYWLLDGNQLVMETQGKHMNLGYQGSVSQQTTTQAAQTSTTFKGTQVAIGLAVDFRELVGNQKLDDVSFIVGAAEITLPPGTNLTDDAQLNLNITQPNGTFNQSIYFMDDPDKGNTRSILGGGSFFENLDATNAPEFFLGFPTVNLKPLLNNGVTLEVGSRVPRENAIAFGLTPGNILTSQGFSFQPEVSSLPGVKKLRFNESENNDLVAVLSNPFLTEQQKDLHYLNSFMWNNFGFKEPKIATTTKLNNNDGGEYWSRYTFSLSRNRNLIYYDPEEARLSYLNVFSNPGISLTTEEWKNTDFNQSVNASVGLIVGGLFNLINPGDLHETLSVAKEEYQQLRPLGNLKSKSTSEERREMNTRLNNTLSYADSNTNLSQVSGSYTFASNVTPNSSSLFQFRTGIYRRLVQFIEQEVTPWNPDEFFVIESVNFSDLNPISYTGVNIPVEITDINRTVDLSFLQATNSNGEVLFNESFVVDSGKIFTVAPIPGSSKAFTLGSGRIVLSTSQQREIDTRSYVGDIYLPAMEFLMSGTLNDFNYALSAGMWFNLFPDSAPMVNSNLSNSVGTQESSMGGILKLALKKDFNNISPGENKSSSQSVSSSHFFSLEYNTNPNALNLSTTSLGNVFQLRETDYSIMFYPILSYAPSILNSDIKSNRIGDLVTFLSLIFSHKSSLNVNGSMSISNRETTYKLETTYNIINNSKFGTLTVGCSYLNSPNNQTINLSNNTTGLSNMNRELRNSSLGWILRYRSPNSNWVINSRLEDGEGGLNGQINMQLKF